MPSQCALAPEAEITAFFVPGSTSVEPRLYITARGTVSDSCGVVTIRRSPLRIWPPEFAIEECREGDVCADVQTPFDVTEEFAIGSAPETVTVRDAGGLHPVKVDVVPDLRSSLRRATNAEEATGVSIGRASLAEAMADAGDQLYAGGHPNQPRTVRAIEITYTSGGVMPPVLSVRADKGT